MDKSSLTAKLSFGAVSKKKTLNYIIIGLISKNYSRPISHGSVAWGSVPAFGVAIVTGIWPGVV